MVSRVGSYIQSLGIISRNSDIQAQMSSLQQQVATGVKHQTFKEYGSETARIQRFRTELDQTEGFLRNIELGETVIKQMDQSMEEAEAQMENVLSAINLLPAQASELDIQSVKTVATAAQKILVEIMNSNDGNKFLFSGSDTANPPMENFDRAEEEIKFQLTNWLDGTNGVDTMLNNLNGLTDSQLGYSLGVQNAGGVQFRTDEFQEADYTIKANDEGFQKMLIGLTALSNITFPDETTDVATKEDFYTTLDGFYGMIGDGVDEIRSARASLSTAALTMGDAKERHTLAQATFLTNRDKLESVDVQDAVVRFQTLETQLEASYRTTAVLSEMSLARILR